MDSRNEGFRETINKNRNFMKFVNQKTFLGIEETVKTDQEKKLPQPPFGHECKGEVIELDFYSSDEMPKTAYADILDARRSVRAFDGNPMTQKQLSFLLWSVQGIQKTSGSYATFRPVPSGGARHPFELYFIARSVEGLKKGVYRYAPLKHIGEKRAAAEILTELDDCDTIIKDLFLNYPPKNASVILLLTCVVYRSEWRYGYWAHRPVLIDLGHAGQNIMLSASAMGLGSCCYAAFDQDICDKLLCVDGSEEYTVYVCSAGSLPKN